MIDHHLGVGDAPRHDDRVSQRSRAPPEQEPADAQGPPRTVAVGDRTFWAGIRTFIARSRQPTRNPAVTRHALKPNFHRHMSSKTVVSNERKSCQKRKSGMGSRALFFPPGLLDELNNIPRPTKCRRHITVSDIGVQIRYSRPARSKYATSYCEHTPPLRNTMGKGCHRPDGPASHHLILFD